MAELRGLSHVHELRIGIVYAFDFRTRMLPYWYADKRMAPCSVRTIGSVLQESGFEHVRIVLQQWTPNFRPSLAKLDGRPLDVLLVSAMQVHAEASYEIIRDAHQMGERRPLILAGGPKAIYEPADYFEIGPAPGVGADCVVTGEVYVLLDLLRAIFSEYVPAESARAAFERARGGGALNGLPGLVYLPTGWCRSQPHAVNTGSQRLLRDLDELPMPEAGYLMIEPPHRRSTLSRSPCTAKQVGKLSIISSVISTHGCKFNCSYCPIPAVNQRTWRHKSPRRLAEEIRRTYETFGIREFFSTDDNFFNQRDTVIALMAELAATKVRGEPISKHIRFYTEATEFDVFKNRDLLPLCREGGMRAIWFGIEDITAELVNKGQTEGKTADLFAQMKSLGIEPMAMMMHNDNQPLRSNQGDLTGLINQAEYLFEQGAVSYQCTYLGPAIGTRDIETAAQSRILYKAVGGEPIPQAYQDGNHVMASRHLTPWDRQMNIIRAYWSFYNPRNTWRVLRRWRGDPNAPKRLLFQFIGQIGLVFTLPKLWRWSRKLKRGPIEVYDGLTRARIPMIDSSTGDEVSWAIEHLPTPYLRQSQRAPISGVVPAKTTRTVRLAVALAR